MITGGDPAGIGPEILERTAPVLAHSGRSALVFATGGADHVERLTEILSLNGAQVRVSDGTADMGRPGPPGQITITAVQNDPSYRAWKKKGGPIFPVRAAPGPVPGSLRILL